MMHVPSVVTAGSWVLFYMFLMSIKTLVCACLVSVLCIPTVFFLNSLQVERELTYEKLSEWTKSDNMMKAEVDLYLPKLKLEENYDLKSPLSSMGIRNAFDPGQADFTGMSVKKDLFISEVIHKAFVEVNEEGTEAAAATAVLMMRSRVLTMTFKADHPFIFFIRHNKSQTILFFGRLCSP